MIIWLRLFSLNISFEILFVVKVTWNRGRSSTWVCPLCAVRVAFICFTLMMLKPKSSGLLEMSSGGIWQKVKLLLGICSWWHDIQISAMLPCVSSISWIPVLGHPPSWYTLKFTTLFVFFSLTAKAQLLICSSQSLQYTLSQPVTVFTPQLPSWLFC